MQQGKMIVVSAPSGSGKTTIVKAMLAADLKLEFSVSACSRQPRVNEQHGRDYYFMSVEEFQKKIAEDAFIEWEEVYSGNYYGTLKSEVQRIWNKGNHVIFDVDVIGGLNIKKKYPDVCLALFIRPPSIAELEKRLRDRSTDQEETIKKRLEKAEYELSFAPQFDRIIINDELKTAISETQRVITQFINL
jgi:guanylate kinase